MAAELDPQRGGCLDALVKIATLGNFGVETRIIYQHQDEVVDPRILRYKAIGIMGLESSNIDQQPSVFVKQRIVRNK